MISPIAFPIDRDSFFFQLKNIKSLDDRINFLATTSYNMRMESIPETILYHFFNDIAAIEDAELAFETARKIVVILKDRIDDVILTGTNETIVDSLPFSCGCDIECDYCEGCKYGCGELDTNCIASEYARDGIVLMKHALKAEGFKPNRDYEDGELDMYHVNLLALFNYHEEQREIARKNAIDKLWNMLTGSLGVSIPMPSK